MSKVLLSTLHKVKEKFGITSQAMAVRFPVLLDVHAGDFDSQIDVNDDNKNWLDALCANIPYPPCVDCGVVICGGDARCHCPRKYADQDDYQREYDLLIAEIRIAEAAQKKLEASPFRQARNAYGFGSGIFGGINLLLTNIVVLGLAATVSLMAAPSILLGGYVYFRGRREEQQLDADAQAEVMEKKVSLLCKHRDAVQQRYRNNQLHLVSTQSLTETPETKLQLLKEKRSPLGNPFSHFLGGSLTTLSVLSVVLKIALVSLLGGPIGWGIAGALALGVGIYFGYKRYKFLVSKNDYEKKMAILSARTNDVDRIKNNAEALTKHYTNEQVFALQAQNTELLRLHNQPLAETTAEHKSSSSSSRPVPILNRYRHFSATTKKDDVEVVDSVLPKIQHSI